MHKGQYLSIGEVAKLSRVNIKSLRYYDRIGVLKPAYVDEETGYRYYLPSQLGMLDAIRFCVDTGIPLREFSAYSTNETIDTGRLLSIAAKTAQNKLRSIREGLDAIEGLQAFIRRNEQLIAAQGPISYTLEPRAYIVTPIPAQFDLMDFSRTLSALQVDAMQHGYRAGYDCGQLMLWKDGSDTPEHYAYSELTGAGDPLENMIHFPETEVTALFVRESRIDDAPAIFPLCFSQPGGKAVFQTEVITRVFDTNHHGYELRCHKKLLT